MSSLILNEMEDIRNKSYLELGIFDNSNFNKILCTSKMSVDMNGKALFTGTTDSFFAQIDKNQMWDIIFIDANHDYEYVLRDFNNAVNHCKEWILIHDMIPPTEQYCNTNLCSDSYRLLMYFIKETNFKVYPMNENYGLTLIKMPAKEISPQEHYKEVSYEVFKRFISEQWLYSKDEIKNILNNKPANINDDLILINAYPNTLEREQILINCINQLKKTGKEILLVSHFPVKSEIYNLVDYFIYDKRNYMLDGSNLWWYKTKDFSFQTNAFITNASYAVFSSIQNGFYFAKNLGKKYVYYFEYDCFISDKDISNLDSFKDEIISSNKYGFASWGFQGSEKGICTLFFLLDVDFFLKIFPPVFNMNDYIRNFPGTFLELYFYKFMLNEFDNLIIIEQDLMLNSIFSDSKFNLSSLEFSHFIDILPKKENKKPVLVITVKKEEKEREYFIEFKNSENNSGITGMNILVYPTGYYYNVLEDNIKEVKIYYKENDKLTMVFNKNPIECCSNRKNNEYVILG